MPKIGNPFIRVWEEIHRAYREVSKKHKIMTSELASIVLLYAPLLSPASIVMGLEENYDIPREEALRIVAELVESLNKCVFEEQEKTKKKIVRRSSNA